MYEVIILYLVFVYHFVMTKKSFNIYINFVVGKFTDSLNLFVFPLSLLLIFDVVYEKSYTF